MAMMIGSRCAKSSFEGGMGMSSAQDILLNDTIIVMSVDISQHHSKLQKHVQKKKNKTRQGKAQTSRMIYGVLF